VDLDNAPARWAALIDLMTETAPETLIVAAKLIPTRTDSLNVEIETFNTAIEAIVNDRAAAGKHIIVVDMYSAFTANSNYMSEWLFDGLHPNDDGYAVMADGWYEAISQYLISDP